MDSPQQSSGRNQNPDAWVEREPATTPQTHYTPTTPPATQPSAPASASREKA